MWMKKGRLSRLYTILWIVTSLLALLALVLRSGR
jgi:hypothetical protein